MTDDENSRESENRIKPTELIPPPPPAPVAKRGRPAHLTYEQVVQILALLSHRTPVRAICEKYELAPAQVYHIKGGRRYSWVMDRLLAEPESGQEYLPHRWIPNVEAGEDIPEEHRYVCQFCNFIYNPKLVGKNCPLRKVEYDRRFDVEIEWHESLTKKQNRRLADQDINEEKLADWKESIQRTRRKRKQKMMSKYSGAIPPHIVQAAIDRRMFIMKKFQLDTHLRMAKRFSKELAEWEEKHGPQDEELKQFLETFPDVEDRINEYSRIIKMDRKIENYLYKASIKEKLKDELGY